MWPQGHGQVLREVRWQVLRKGHEEGQVRRQKMRTEMRCEVRSEVHAEMRAQELTSMGRRRQTASLSASMAEWAGASLLNVYGSLARRGEHLFGGLLDGQPPRQWAHYPEEDAFCRSGGYQWFYHSHSPEDRPGAVEHGHIHLFARRPLWGRRLQSSAERAFAKLCGDPSPKSQANTRHLLTIGFNAKGIPISIFMVNSWVTGDLMLGADLTMDLLSKMELDTGNREIDAVIESTVRLHLPELAELMAARDRAMAAHAGPNRLDDPSLELLSEIQIDLDARLRALG